MLYKDVIGQLEVKRSLIELVQANRLSHAMLFLGPEGSGALALAMAFAQYVCLTPNLEDLGSPRSWIMPSGERHISPSTDLPVEQQADQWMQLQPAYAKTSQLIHPDIHFSYPVISKKPGDKPVSTDFIVEWRAFIGQQPYGNIYDWLQFIGAENKQGNITAYECSDIIHKLSLKSFESRFKILLMWMPEYLGNEGNKLLKLIEEPPEDTLFILVAENESLILPTIRSRIQLVKIPYLGSTDIEQALMQRDHLAADQARQLSSISEGNYREAQRLLEHAGENWEVSLRDWLNTILKSGPSAQVKWVEEISKAGRENQKQFLRYFNHLLEQAIRLRVMGPLHVHGADKEKDFAERLNKIADLGQQQAIVEELDKAIYYVERNANAKMLFQALTIKIYHIIADHKIATVS
jgi:DNA polymerase III subunit delta'